MRVQGGKAKIAKDLARVMLSRQGPTTVYLEPFLGGCSVLPLMAPYFVRSMASDISRDLIDLWNAAVFLDWRPPETLSRSEWYALKDQTESSPLRTFAGYGCSYGGRWFQGYAETRGDDYAGAAYRGILWRADALKDVRSRGKLLTLTEADYDEYSPADHVLAYCDPPYSGRKAYPGQPPFDTQEFWDHMDDWVRDGVRVHVSEYEAPAHWVPIWTKQVNGSMSATTNTFPVTEHLFVHRSQVDL